jgi:hypothetical protein
MNINPELPFLAVLGRSTCISRIDNESQILNSFLGIAHKFCVLPSGKWQARLAPRRTRRRGA